MGNLKILLVEDSQVDINTCMATVSVYQKEKHREIEIVQASKFAQARELLDNTFDGAIVDLRLESNEEGNDVIKEIRSKYRIPVIVMTGTPEDAKKDVPYLGIYTKGETGYDELLDILFATYDTGITKILGGHGYLEQTMDKIFWNSILPHLNEWKRYKEKDKDTEKALLRFVVSHIAEMVDDDVEKYFVQEMYIYPVISDNLKTGSIVKNKETNEHYVILSPACDLALHNGSFKTDRILVCNIHSTDPTLDESVQKQKDIIVSETDNEQTKARKLKSQATIRAKVLEKIYGNTLLPYFHYLPKISIFNGGVINFRMIETYLPERFNEIFEKPYLQISGAFTKDVVARFSSYYARQGQPDFDLDE